jgi:intracellular sulfur oxidation DsrE/DsrF family protein
VEDAPVSRATDRRGFLGQAAALAITPAILGHPFGVATSHERRAARAAWDMSWVDALAAAKHKAVFDATLISNGLALGHVDRYLRGYHEVYNLEERELRPVLVIRHEAVPMFLNDAFWQKYQLAQKLRINDPATGTIAARNPFAAPGAKPVADWTTIQELYGRGVIVLGCDKALRSVVALMAQQTGQAAEAVTAEARASVVPNVVLMPSGIFAVLRAEEAGCVYIRST